jgi:hypothetical protein
MSRLRASLDAPPSGRVRPVWFDAAAYGRARLLDGGDLPWRAPAELTSFFGKIQAMFDSDVILADVADVFAQRAAADEALRAAMGARSRPGYALRSPGSWPGSARTVLPLRALRLRPASRRVAGAWWPDRSSGPMPTRRRTRNSCWRRSRRKPSRKP